MSQTAIIVSLVIIGIVAVIALIIATVAKTTHVEQNMANPASLIGLPGFDGIDGMSPEVPIQNSPISFIPDVHLTGWNPAETSGTSLFSIGLPIDNQSSQDILPTDPWGTTRYVPITCHAAGTYVFYAQVFIENTTFVNRSISTSFHLVNKRFDASEPEWNQFILTQSAIDTGPGATSVVFLPPATYRAASKEVLYFCYCSTTINHLDPANAYLTIFQFM